MPLAMQAKLLRVLQEQEIERVGGNTTFKIECVWSRPTNKDLVEACAKGSFRADLYDRLNVVPLEASAAPRAARRHPASRRALLGRGSQSQCAPCHDPHTTCDPRADPDPFPGNVRELRNLMERLSF